MTAFDPDHPLLHLDSMMPAGWEQSPVFRRVFLVYLGAEGPLPQLFAAFAAIAHEMAYDRTPWLEGVEADELVMREIVALREDLDHVTGYLISLAQQLAGSPNHPVETLLAPELAKVVPHVRKASEMLGELVPASEPGEPLAEETGNS